MTTQKAYSIRTFQDVVNVGHIEGPQAMERCITDLCAMFRRALEMQTELKALAATLKIQLGPEDVTCGGMNWTDDGDDRITGTQIHVKVTP